jgi:hypothetical protein
MLQIRIMWIRAFLVVADPDPVGFGHFWSWRIRILSDSGNFGRGGSGSCRIRVFLVVADPYPVGFGQFWSWQIQILSDSGIFGRALTRLSGTGSFY